MIKGRVLALLGALPLGLMAGSALAQSSGNDMNVVGVGAGLIPSYPGSDDYIAVPAIVARGKISGFGYSFRGTKASVDLVRSNNDNSWKLGFGPAATLRLERTTRIRDDRVARLGKLDKAIELGGWIGATKTGVITSDYDVLSMSVTATYDVAGAHGSYVVTPSIEYGTPLSTKTFVGMSVSADYVGRKFGDYYFDVSAPGALNSGLSPYDGADKAGFRGINTGVLIGQSLTGDLTGGLAVFAAGGYSRLLGDYARSPIVADAGDRNQFMGAVGLAYIF